MPGSSPGKAHSFWSSSPASPSAAAPSSSPKKNWRRSAASAGGRADQGAGRPLYRLCRPAGAAHRAVPRRRRHQFLLPAQLARQQDRRDRAPALCRGQLSRRPLFVERRLRYRQRQAEVHPDQPQPDHLRAGLLVCRRIRRRAARELFARPQGRVRRHLHRGQRQDAGGQGSTGDGHRRARCGRRGEERRHESRGQSARGARRLPRRRPQRLRRRQAPHAGNATPC